MEPYIEFNISCEPDKQEPLIAELADLDFEGFVEHEKGFSAFIVHSKFNPALFEQICAKYGVDVAAIPQQVIEQQNWNAQWEAGYEPIMIENRILVKAPFHVLDDSYEMELIIKPKNTFGTGHHETTQLMLGLMLEEKFTDKRVLDYGCGTGVLGIMAEKSGAREVVGIDIDAWCLDNIEENLSLNNANRFRFLLGDLSVVDDKPFDIIVANINKNILLASFTRLSELLVKEGILLISGFYETDLSDLQQEASSKGLSLKSNRMLNNWCAAALVKS